MSTQAMRPDPRGPHRTVTSAEFTPTGYRVLFAECSHEAHTNATMPVRVGDRVRCFACREAAR